MIIIIPTIKYSFTYNTFTMEVYSNNHGYFFQCIVTFLFAKFFRKFEFYLFWILSIFFVLN